MFAPLDGSGAHLATGVRDILQLSLSVVYTGLLVAFSLLICGKDAAGTNLYSDCCRAKLQVSRKFLQICIRASRQS
jgi:hypothetical protein